MRHTESSALRAPTHLTFHAADGTPLVGTLFEPDQARRPAVLIAGALGVAQRHYAPFAAWLAARGHAVLTFDLRGLEADLLTWSRSDFGAAVGHLVAFNGGHPVTVVGHSLGLHHAGMTDAATQARISRAIGVGSGAGYWRDWAAPSRRVAPLMLHLAGPLLIPLFGYFPGRRLRMVGDLPAAVMRQWTLWCRHPEFAWGAEPDLVCASLEAARFPVVAFSFTDDEAMTETCTRKLLAAFRHAPTNLVRLAPQEVGMACIGHLGAFRPEGSERLWLRIAGSIEADDHLLEHVAAR